MSIPDAVIVNSLLIYKT